jgi:NAD(P)-dependent dehydrogenase (short-subunit alcohol dehydrogenase family)
MPALFSNKHVVIIGGSSGIGFAVAQQLVKAGARVALGGRDLARLQHARQQLEGRATIAQVDLEDKASIARFFESVGAFDHLFAPGATYRYGDIQDIDDEVAESPFRSKFWGQYYAVRHALPYLEQDGSIVLMSGAAGARPLGTASAYAACNSAIEGLGRALALELAPIRVNVVSPGTIDSALWQRRPTELREAAYRGYAEATALGRVGHVTEVADAVVYLFGNTYTTGSTLYPDGGYTLR